MTTTDTRDELMRTCEYMLNTAYGKSVKDVARYARSHLTQQPGEAEVEAVRTRHQRDATLRDIDHATHEWRTHKDRATLLRYIDSRTLQAASPTNAASAPSSPAAVAYTMPPVGPTPAQGVTREKIVALIMKHVKPEPTKVRLNPKPSIDEIEANINSENPRKFDLNADGNVYELLPGPPLTAGRLADALIAAFPSLVAQPLHDPNPKP